MQKPSIFVLTTLASGAIFLSSAEAQQTATGNTQTPRPATTQSKPPDTAATPAPAATATKPGATKPGQASASKTTPLTLTTDKDKVSYAIGMNMGKAMKRDGVDVDSAILLRGLKDALSGGKLLMTDQEVQTTLTTLQTELRSKQEEKQKKEGEAFLAANKTKEGVVTLSSGLQYKILREGTGPKPAAADSVTVNYRGTLLDGTEFDSSYKRGQPATFPVSGIIKGWTEALQLMPVGSKWQLFIPSDLAYGPRQAGPTIGPNSTLLFEVELLSIQPKPAPAPAAAPTQPSAPATPPAPATAPKPTPNPPPTPKP